MGLLYLFFFLQLSNPGKKIPRITFHHIPFMTNFPSHSQINSEKYRAIKNFIKKRKGMGPNSMLKIRAFWDLIP
jgi:hypothetical protein